jgi:ATP-dependent DNA ligase
MPLVRIPAAFDHPDWPFELKHDGFRALAIVRGHQCELVSRRGHLFTSFQLLGEEIAHSVRSMDCVLDGEGKSFAAAPMGAAASTICCSGVSGHTSPRSIY